MIILIPIFLSIVDIFAGSMMSNHSFLLMFKGIAGYLAIISMGKGAFSFFGSMASGYYFDWMGVIDVIGGIFLFLISIGVSISFFNYMGITLILKGFYSLIRLFGHF